MTDKKISQLDLVTGVSPADEMIINVGGGDTATTSRVSLETLLGGNEVSGIQYSSIFTANMDVRKTEDFNTSFMNISSETDSSGVQVTKPILDWMTASIEVDVPENADGAIIIGYTATATIPTDNLVAHPFYNSGSQTQAPITAQLIHNFRISGATMEPDFNGEAGLMGWQDTHNTTIYMQDGIVEQSATGRQKRENFISVNQIAKIGYCKFPQNIGKLTINYSLDVYRAEFLILNSRPLRLLVLPTQGLSSADVASIVNTDFNSEQPYPPVAIDDYNNELASVQMREIRHIMTMMDAYETATPGISVEDKATLDQVRTTLLGLNGGTEPAVVGTTIKLAKQSAASVINFSLAYNTAHPFGLFT